MTRRPNRVVLLVLGLLLLAAAVVVFLAAAGVLPIDSPGDLYRQAQASAAAYPLAWTVGVAAAGLILALIGAWLVRRQLRLRPGGRLDTLTVQRGERGRTTLKAASVAGAAGADLRQLRGVVDSHVRMVTFGSRPRFIVDLDYDREVPSREVLDRTEPAYGRLCRHLGVEAVHVDTVLRPASPNPGGRVK